MNGNPTPMAAPTDDPPLRADRPVAATAGGTWGGPWLRELRVPAWLRIMGARPPQLLIPVVLSTCVAALEGVSVGLLVPIAVGVTKRDFSFVRDLSGFSALARWFPGWFGPGANDFARLFLLAAGGGVVLCNRLAGNEYALVREASSPSGVRKAILYTRMGGGAAGWCRQYLAIVAYGVSFEPRRATDDLSYAFSASCGSDVGFEWQSDVALKVGYTIGDVVDATMWPCTRDGVVALRYESRP